MIEATTLMALAAKTADQVWAIRPTALQGYMAARVSGLARRVPASMVVSEDGASVAVYQIKGVIVPHAEWDDEVDAGRLTEAINAAAADDGIGGVMLVIDSPGGSTAGLSELTAAVASLAAVKPVYASVSGCCCSAAYRVAARCTAIYAGARDDIGSIGTRSLVYDWSKHFADLGIEAISSDTGPLKSLGIAGTVVTDEQRAFLQSRVDYLQGDFRKDVVEGRGFTDEQYEAVATGGYWFGEQALSMGLIDGLQTKSETFAALAAAVTSRVTQGSQEMAEATENLATPKVATASEIKAKFPGTSADFREEMTELGATIEEVAIAWAGACESALAAERAARAEAEAKAKEAAEAAAEPVKAGRGVAAVSSIPSEREDDRDAVQAWRDLVAECAEKCGDRQRGFMAARRKNPELARAAREAAIAS